MRIASGTRAAGLYRDGKPVGAKRRAGSVAKHDAEATSVMQRQGFSYARNSRLRLQQMSRCTSERQTDVGCGGPGR